MPLGLPLLGRAVRRRDAHRRAPIVGYAAEVVRPRNGAGVQTATRTSVAGGFDGGAMVLTTSRSAAGGIADYVATELRRAGDDTPVLSALVLGNPRRYARSPTSSWRRFARRH